MKKLLTTIFMLLCCVACWQATEAKAQDEASVRRELEAQYTKLIEAHYRKDLKTILALKTSDFHTIGPDGKINDHQMMAEYSRQFLEMNQPPFTIKMSIKELKVSENRLIAVAVILQEATRYRELAGKRRKVETSVVQRETWAKTPDGWKLKVVDDVHGQRRWIDGKRVDPSKPYNPDDPPYQPEEPGQSKTP
jgi:ketosteroid isomerase-like protein